MSGGAREEEAELRALLAALGSSDKKRHEEHWNILRDFLKFKGVEVVRYSGWWRNRKALGERGGAEERMGPAPCPMCQGSKFVFQPPEEEGEEAVIVKEEDLDIPQDEEEDGDDVVVKEEELDIPQDEEEEEEGMGGSGVEAEGEDVVMQDEAAATIDGEEGVEVKSELEIDDTEDDGEEFSSTESRPRKKPKMDLNHGSALQQGKGKKWEPVKGTITHRVTEASKFLRNETTKASEARSHLLDIEESKSASLTPSQLRLAGCDWGLKLEMKHVTDEKGGIYMLCVQLLCEADFPFPWRCRLSSVTFHLISGHETPNISLPPSKYNLKSRQFSKKFIAKTASEVLCNVATAKKYVLNGRDELELRVDFVVEELAVAAEEQTLTLASKVLAGPKPRLPRRKHLEALFLGHWRKDTPQLTAIISDAVRLLRSGNDADLTIRSKEGKEFKAHQLILETRNKNIFDFESGDEELDWMSRLSSKTIEGVLTILYGGRDLEKKEDNLLFIVPIYIEISSAAKKHKCPELQELADLIGSLGRRQLSKQPSHYSPSFFLRDIKSLRNSFKGEHLPIFGNKKVSLSVHRVILAMRIPGYSSRGAMRKLSPNALEAVCDYLYLGKIRVCEEKDLLDLLDVAEKYELADLKALVGFQFEAKCSTKNACRLHSLVENRPGMEVHAEFFKSFIDKCFG